MRVVIVGAAGQVGRALLAGAPPDVEVIAYVRGELDISDEGSVWSRVRRPPPDVIINAAAYTLVDRAESEPELARRVNAEGPRNLALAARDVGARLVHLSTDFVFDGTSSEPYRPDARTNPVSVYGATKRLGEEAALDVLGERCAVLRTAWVYGTAGHNFLLTMLGVMRASGSARVVADQVGTPTAARSVAEAVWWIVSKPEVAGVHHWTDAGVASWYDFAVAIAEEGASFGLVGSSVSVAPITTAEYPTRARRPAYSVLDKTSLISRGMVPTHWRKRLRDVLGAIRNG